MANIKIQMDPTQKILLKRHLEKNGEAQVKFTKEVAKNCNNYIPFKRGYLKDKTVELQKDKIIYNAPYAANQYYLNKGNGKQGTSYGGLRGKMWDRRMWANRGDEIVKTIAKFAGGHKK